MKIGATATPVTNNPENIFGIFKFLNPNLFPKWGEFDRKFLKYIGFGRPKKPKNMPELKKVITPFVFKKNKEDISDQLPKIAVYQIYCDMPKEIKKSNDKIFKELDELNKQSKILEEKLSKEQLENSKSFMSLKAKTLEYQTYAQELANSPEIFQLSSSKNCKQFYVEEESPKLEQCLELIDSIISSGEKVCVFTKFERMQDILEKHILNRFKKVKVAKVNGSLNANARYEQIYTKFRDDDDYKVILASNAMAEGANLSKCKYLIEYEFAESYAIQTQRHGRLERADSVHSNVIIYQLVLRDSWDEIQQKIVSGKKECHVELFN